MKSSFNYFLLIGTFFTIILTQYVQQDISILYNHFNSDYSFISNYNTYKNSIMSYFFVLFDIFEFNFKDITIFISILFSLIAMIAIYIFGFYFKKMNPENLCQFICMLYFLEKLRLINSGFNYPINIIIPGYNTGGSIGFLFSILTIIIFISKPNVGLIFVPLNLFIHPTLGLLTLSYIVLLNFLEKNFKNMIFLILICMIFLIFNYESGFTSDTNLIQFIHMNDFHRMPLRLQHFECLILPLFLSLIHNKKKELLGEWIFILICIFISFIYYNLEYDFLELPFLSLMPNRGVNIGIAIIFIKSCADLIINAKINKLVCLIFFALAYNQLFYSSMQLTSIFIGCMVGLIFVSISILFKIKLNLITKPNEVYEIKKIFFIPLLLSFIIYLNLLSASVNINQMVYDKPKSYDEFFITIKEKFFYIDLVGDYSISKRNQFAIPIIDLSTLDAFSYNPELFNEGNKIFKTIFDKNLWDINLNNSQSVKYKDVSNILESNTEKKWNKLKKINLKYILCPASSQLKLNKAWEDKNYIIFEI